MKLEEILEELARVMRSSGLSLDSNDMCRFVVNEATSVTIEKSFDEGVFFLYAIAGQIQPGDDKTALDLLEANLFCKETGTATLAYDPSTRSVILFQRFEEKGTNFEQFDRDLKTFISALEHWKGELSAFQKKTAPQKKYMDYQLLGLRRQKDLQALFE